MCFCPSHLLAHLFTATCRNVFYVCLTVLQAHPQLFVVLLLHVIDDLTLVLEGIGLFDAGHEVSLNYRVGRAVEQVTIWKILAHNHKTKGFI